MGVDAERVTATSRDALPFPTSFGRVRRRRRRLIGMRRRLGTGLRVGTRLAFRARRSWWLWRRPLFPLCAFLRGRRSWSRARPALALGRLERSRRQFVAQRVAVRGGTRGGSRTSGASTVVFARVRRAVAASSGVARRASARPARRLARPELLAARARPTP